MNSKYEKSFSMIKLVYEIKDEKTITIFHPYFVQNNKNNCKMIVNNKLCLLTDKLEVTDNNNKLLKIKLLILNNKKINLSYMFHECKSLKKFHMISEEEAPKKEDKDENIKNKDSFVDLIYQSNNEILSSYNNNLTNIFNEAIKIYNKYNDLNYNNEKEKMNFIINLNDEFLLSSNSSIKSQNNNNIEYSSFYDGSFSFKSRKIKRMNINENESKKYIIKKYNIIATDMRYMFYECSSPLSISGLSKINTSNVIYMNHMFKGCSLLKKINEISIWNIDKVKDINSMFYGCSSLKSLPDISKWITNQVENMKEIFSKCSSLESLPDISNWNIDKVIDISGLCSGCSTLIGIPDISKWNTENIIDLNELFIF